MAKKKQSLLDQILGNLSKSPSPIAPLANTFRDNENTDQLIENMRKSPSPFAVLPREDEEDISRDPSGFLDNLKAGLGNGQIRSTGKGRGQGDLVPSARDLNEGRDRYRGLNEPVSGIPQEFSDEEIRDALRGRDAVSMSGIDSGRTYNPVPDNQSYMELRDINQMKGAPNVEGDTFSQKLANTRKDVTGEPTLFDYLEDRQMSQRPEDKPRDYVMNPPTDEEVYNAMPYSFKSDLDTAGALVGDIAEGGKKVYDFIGGLFGSGDKKEVPKEKEKDFFDLLNSENGNQVKAVAKEAVRSGVKGSDGLKALLDKAIAQGVNKEVITSGTPAEDVVEKAYKEASEYGKDPAEISKSVKGAMKEYQASMQKRKKGLSGTRGLLDVLSDMPLETDYAPLLSLVDTWTGSNFTKSYKRPTSGEERATQIASLQDALDKQAYDANDNIFKTKMLLEREKERSQDRQRAIKKDKLSEAESLSRRQVVKAQLKKIKETDPLDRVSKIATIKQKLSQIKLNDARIKKALSSKNGDKKPPKQSDIDKTVKSFISTSDKYIGNNREVRIGNLMNASALISAVNKRKYTMEDAAQIFAKEAYNTNKTMAEVVADRSRQFEKVVPKEERSNFIKKYEAKIRE